VHSQLLPFVGAAILIALTPGADAALVVRNALVAGATPARRTALGTTAGLLVWGAASACGVAAVLNAIGRGLHRRQAGRRAVPPLARPAGHPPRRRPRGVRPCAQRLSLYATVVPRAGDVLRRPPVRRALDRATGVVLIGLGVRLALTRR
jgi:threonine/homoserine/homoserine lactone efflux protein